MWTGGGAVSRGSVMRSARGNPRSPVSRCGGSASTTARYRIPASWTCASSGAWPSTTSSSRRSEVLGTTSPSWATRRPAGTAARSRSSKCSASSSSAGSVQPGWPASEKREISQRSWARAWLSGAGSGGSGSWDWAQACFSAAQLGRPCSHAIAAWASCRVGNSPTARRRLASSRKNRRLGRAGSERDPPDTAALPSRPGPLTRGGKDSPSIASTLPVSLKLCLRT